MAVAVALAAQNPPPVTIRVDVQLVRMLVTVRDEMGRLVGGLDKQEFRITDNGVEQELAIFERQTTQPLSVALLVDTSGSTAGEARYEVDAVRRFLKRLLAEGNPRDSAALISFNDEVTLLAPYTRSLGRLEKGLGGLRGRGATALYDAVYLAVDEMEHRDGRRVVIVVSDGGDTFSRTSFQQALEGLHRANAVLYSILVVPVKGEAGRNLRGENSLITLSQWTGGKVFYPTPGADLDRAFQDILKDLRTQYQLAYYLKNVPPSKDRFHRVQVGVTRPRHSASARNGYYAAALP
jgi:Ca-activated chloride channel family protein